MGRNGKRVKNRAIPRDYKFISSDIVMVFTFNKGASEPLSGHHSVFFRFYCVFALLTFKKKCKFENLFYHDFRKKYKRIP